MRVLQWYKNLLVFLPILFAGQIFNLEFLPLAFIGFFSLCFVSSASYFINDVVDLEKDKLHPRKSKRLLASGRISVFQAGLLSLFCLVVGLVLGLYLSWQFFAFALGLFVLTQLYTFFLKTVAFADVLAIAVNFVLRALAGVFIVVSTPFVMSSWLILCTFFLALFLALSKRASEVHQHKAKLRSVLASYTPAVVSSLLGVATTCLILAYASYCFFSQYALLLVTLPFALFTIFRFFHLIYAGSPIPQHLELFYRDRQLVLGVALWVCSVLLVIYWFVL